MSVDLSKFSFTFVFFYRNLRIELEVIVVELISNATTELKGVAREDMLHYIITLESNL